MIVLFGIYILFLLYQIISSSPTTENNSIGKSKIINDMEYFNIGTLDDKDNWIEVGSTVVQYYVNVYVNNGIYLVRIEKELNENAVDYIECYDLKEAERRLILLNQIYLEKGDDYFHHE